MPRTTPAWVKSLHDYILIQPNGPILVHCIKKSQSKEHIKTPNTNLEWTSARLAIAFLFQTKKKHNLHHHPIAFRHQSSWAGATFLVAFLLGDVSEGVFGQGVCWRVKRANRGCLDSTTKQHRKFLRLKKDLANCLCVRNITIRRNPVKEI